MGVGVGVVDPPHVSEGTLLAARGGGGSKVCWVEKALLQDLGQAHVPFKHFGACLAGRLAGAGQGQGQGSRQAHWAGWGGGLHVGCMAGGWGWGGGDGVDARVCSGARAPAWVWVLASTHILLAQCPTATHARPACACPCPPPPLQGLAAPWRPGGRLCARLTPRWGGGPLWPMGQSSHATCPPPTPRSGVVV